MKHRSCAPQQDDLLHLRLTGRAQRDAESSAHGLQHHHSGHCQDSYTAPMGDNPLVLVLNPLELVT